MARPPNTDERRAQITRGLLKAMSAKGYDGATIQDIARAARLSPGLVHYHFGSKGEVLEALIDSVLSSHFEAVDRRMEAAGPKPVAQLDALIDAHLATGATANPELLSVWVLLGGEALKSKAVRAQYTAGLTELHRRIVALVPDAAAASGILAAIEGYFVVAATARALVPRGTAAETVKRMARGLLR
jgi:TetR/AcrR family transcriptional repressor of bet genes